MNFAIEVDGQRFELRPAGPQESRVFVNGKELSETFSLHYEPNKLKGSARNGAPVDRQKDAYLRTVAEYLKKHPEAV